MTCMIAHVTPSSANYDETYNTLVYANRAKNITTRVSFLSFYKNSCIVLLINIIYLNIHLKI